MRKVKIPVSAGELVDKITIHELKIRYLKNSELKSLISQELKILNRELNKIEPDKQALEFEKFSVLRSKLYYINNTLWKIENKLRQLELKRVFKKEFIVLARKVYKNNDRRSKIKRSIDELLKSEIHDIKQYFKY